tara:strand:- start:263 stop:394 length:132 start_codon:yes stop_codon:yes gene_type:complete
LNDTAQYHPDNNQVSESGIEIIGLLIALRELAFESRLNFRQFR